MIKNCVSLCVAWTPSGRQTHVNCWNKSSINLSTVIFRFLIKYEIFTFLFIDSLGGYEYSIIEPFLWWKLIKAINNIGDSNEGNGS